jgi:hypothetical protein
VAIATARADFIRPLESDRTQFIYGVAAAPARYEKARATLNAGPQLTQPMPTSGTATSTLAQSLSQPSTATPRTPPEFLLSQC